MRLTDPPPTATPAAAKSLPWRGRGLIGLLALLAALLAALPAGVAAAQDAKESPAGEPPPAVEVVKDSQNLADVPGDVAGLLDLDARIRRVVDKVLPATVGLMVGNAQGSGVIISDDGLVLTAAHVSGPPGGRLRVVMPDGTQYRAVSLGRNQELDDGLVRIVDDAAKALPHVALGKSGDLPPGTWTVALGHPGGYQQDRPPVVRVGRILANNDDLILTDNTLVGGDSGGPLFDLDGRLIAIHSRIGGRIQANIHVPIDRFLDDWTALIDSKDQNDPMPSWMRRGPQRATDGMGFDTSDLSARGARVTEMTADGPADKAGIQINDRVIALDGRPVQNGQELMIRRLALRPGEAVTYRVLRDGQEQDYRVVPVRLGRQQGQEQEQERGRGDLRGDRGRGGGRFSQPADPDRPVLGFTPARDFAEPGIKVVEVGPGSPAEAVGLRGEDVILAVDGKIVRDVNELGDTLLRSGAGREVELTVRRDGREQRVKITPAREGDVYPRGE